MQDSILMAIESLCSDIAADTNAEDNLKRTECIATLTESLFSLGAIPKRKAKSALTAVAASEKAPKAGERFTYRGMEFVSLGIEQGGLLAVATHTLEQETPFDESGSNDWRTSTLRKYLNEEHIKEFDKGNLLPFVSDLTSDDGLKDYGTAEDYIFILSCDLYRKYRPLMPKYNAWVWTITPWSCYPGNAYNARIVNTDGSLNHNSAYGAYAVAPACLFNPSIFEQSAPLGASERVKA